MVELVHAGRPPAQLARESGVAAQSLSSRVAQAARRQRQPPRGKDVLSTAKGALQPLQEGPHGQTDMVALVNTVLLRLASGLG